MNAQPQVSLYETTIENPALEEALERRWKAKEKAGAARKTMKEADDQVKGLVADLDLADAPVRVGRFVVSQREVAARAVAFETAPTSRLQIKLLEDAA